MFVPRTFKSNESAFTATQGNKQTSLPGVGSRISVLVLT